MCKFKFLNSISLFVLCFRFVHLLTINRLPQLGVYCLLSQVFFWYKSTKYSVFLIGLWLWICSFLEFLIRNFQTPCLRYAFPTQSFSLFQLVTHKRLLLRINSCRSGGGKCLFLLMGSYLRHRKILSTERCLQGTDPFSLSGLFSHYRPRGIL